MIAFSKRKIYFLLSFLLIFWVWIGLIRYEPSIKHDFLELEGGAPHPRHVDSSYSSCFWFSYYVAMDLSSGENCRGDHQTSPPKKYLLYI